MTDRPLQFLCTLASAAALATATIAVAQTPLGIQLNGLPASATCTTTQINVGTGLSASWNLTATTQVEMTVTANGIVVKQNVKPLPSAVGTSPLDGITVFSTTVAMPYTVVYALTPLLPGASTAAGSFDCVGGVGTNFRVLNGPSFTPISTGASLENPQIGAAESGVGLVSGWACGATSIQVSFDGGARIPVPYGSPRADTASVCGTQTNSGFGLLFNYNTLGPGVHMATVYMNGGNAIVGSAPFVVNTFGTEFLTGAQATLNLPNFPTAGKAAVLNWQQATQQFTIASTANTPAPVTGNYQGAYLGTATGCGAPTFSINNVQFAFTQTGDAVTLVATMPGMTPSSCTFNGNFQYNVAGAQHTVQNGSYTCNNGQTGTWGSNGMSFNNAGGSGSLNATTGSCSSQGRIGFARTD
jgi:hypothetical protein